MPCYDARDEPSSVREETRKESADQIAKLEAMLCGMLTVWRDEGFSMLQLKKLFNEAETGIHFNVLVEWWKDHQRRDERKSR